MRLEIEDVADVVRRLRWFNHLERKDAGDWISACRNYMAIARNAGKGRSKKRRNEAVKDDLKNVV